MVGLRKLQLRQLGVRWKWRHARFDRFGRQHWERRKQPKAVRAATDRGERRRSGGSPATGGNHGSGGVVGTGGASATGGANGSGGATATGGASGGCARGSGGGAGGTAEAAPARRAGSRKAGTGGARRRGGGSVAVAKPSFDWVGVVGSGQSLSVGTTPAALTTQPYNNLMLALNGATVPGTGTNPWDPTVSGLTMVPLVEPVRALETAYPSPYPGNIYGETPHAAMANEITRFVKAASASADYVTVHTIVGESGQGIVALVKEAPEATPAPPGAPTRRPSSRPAPSPGWPRPPARATASASW